MPRMEATCPHCHEIVRIRHLFSRDARAYNLVNAIVRLEKPDDPCVYVCRTNVGRFTPTACLAANGMRVDPTQLPHELTEKEREANMVCACVATQEIRGPESP
ncbi:MAG: hypothetical protein GWN97_03315 [Thermoplasmata archaeon]|nr:hypothetical protein [Thermoplasmata archaeon]